MAFSKVISNQPSMEIIEEVNEGTEFRDENPKSNCSVFCNSFFYEFGQLFKYVCLCRCLCCTKREYNGCYEEGTFNEYNNDISMESYRISTNSNGHANSDRENHENRSSYDENRDTDRENHGNRSSYDENRDTVDENQTTAHENRKSHDNQDDAEENRGSFYENQTTINENRKNQDAADENQVLAIDNQISHKNQVGFQENQDAVHNDQVSSHENHTSQENHSKSHENHDVSHENPATREIFACFPPNRHHYIESHFGGDYHNNHVSDLDLDWD